MLDFLIEFIPLFILVISPILLGSVDVFPKLLINLSAFLILFLWAARRIIDGSFEFVDLPVNKPMLLFLFFILIQYVFIDFFVRNFQLGAVYRQKIMEEALRLIAYFIFFFVIVNNFQERKKMSRMLSLLIVLGFIFSVIGIIQRLSGAQKIFWMVDAGGPGRFFSYSRSQSHFACYIDMIIFLNLGIMFSYFPLLRSELKALNGRGVARAFAVFFQKGIWFYLFSFIIMASALFYSLSRGGIIAFLCGIIFFSFLAMMKGMTKRGYLVLFIMLISVSAMLVWINAPEDIVKRFSKPSGDSTKNTAFITKNLVVRDVLGASAIEMIKSYPLCGVGYGAFEFVYNKSYKPDALKHFYVDYPHNDYLQLFSEVGFTGFMIFFIAACAYLFIVLRTLRKRHDPFSVGVGIGAAAALFSMVIHSIFDFNFHIPATAVLFFAVAALGLTAVSSRIDNDGKKPTLLTKTKPIPINGSYIRAAALFAAAALFFTVSAVSVKRYMGYRISIDKTLTIPKLERAVRLDPMSARCRFLLGKFFIEKKTADKDQRAAYIKKGLEEVRKAASLNPWDEYYPAYLDLAEKIN